MKHNRMVIIGRKESFIIRILINKVLDENIDCTYVPGNIDDINDQFSRTSLFVLYMDEEKAPNEGVLRFLADSLKKKEIPILLIGDAASLALARSYISEKWILKEMPRPVDNAEFVQTIREFFHITGDNAFENASDTDRDTNHENAVVPKSILVVDDDIHYLSLVREWIKDSYKVYMANSGLQAIKLLGKNKVDLILLDYEMPVTSGPQVLEMLRSDPDTDSIPVMFLTGKDDKESVVSVMSLRPNGYILKRVHREELLERLKEFFHSMS